MKTKQESGAALMTVIVATVLLGTACIALLSAVGASSQNNTDALNEAKAYWAAESGLQATINVLRYGDVEYSDAMSNSTLAYNASTFPSGLPYSGDRVVMNSEAAYAVEVSNPDSSLPYTYYTTGSFRAGSGTVVVDNSTPKICFPNCNAATTNRVEIVFAPQASRNVDYSAHQRIGSYRAFKYGPNPVTIPVSPTASSFRVEWEITSPRTDASRTIRGRITSATASGVTLTFDAQVYEVAGSRIEICGGPSLETPGVNGNCSNVTLALNYAAVSATDLYAHVTPTEPYRMKAIAKGYGPNGSVKQLEGVIQKNLFDDTPATAALTMLGSGASITFGPGPGNPTYCGVDPGIGPDDPIPRNNDLPACVVNPNNPSAPSIGVLHQSDLNAVNAASTNGTIVPAPDIITDGPWWTQSAADMHQYINDLRDAARQSGTYIPDGQGTTTLNTIGNYAQGSGLTFCEGDCTAGTNEAGGVLVVTGRFEYSGNYSHRGTIIVIGPMHRNGGGNGIILGNIVIAPYNPADLNAGFGSPSFTTNGGGTSDIIYTGSSTDFDGTNAFTNRMRGVAEK